MTWRGATLEMIPRDKNYIDTLINSTKCAMSSYDYGLSSRQPDEVGLHTHSKGKKLRKFVLNLLQT